MSERGRLQRLCRWRGRREPLIYQAWQNLASEDFDKKWKNTGSQRYFKNLLLDFFCTWVILENPMFNHSSPKGYSSGLEGEFEGLQFQYKIAFDPKTNALLIKVFQENKPVTRFEKFGIHILNLQDRFSKSNTLHPLHLDFIQHLLRFAKLNSWEGYYVLPRTQTAYFLQKLSKFENTKSFLTQKPVVFSKKLLIPLLILEEKSFREIHLTLQWQNESLALPENSPLVLFAGHRPWAKVGEVFYPLKNTKIDPWLEQFNEQGQLTLTGLEALDFIQNHLPVLIKREEVILPPSWEPPQVIREKPESHCKIDENPKTRQLLLNLHFSYAGHLMAPFEKDSDLLMEIKAPEKTLLLCRDLAHERETLEKLYSKGFHRVGTSQFEMKEEEAFNFISEELPSLKEAGPVLGEEKLRRFHLHSHLNNQSLKAQVTSQGIDWFTLDLKYKIDDLEIPFEVVQSLIQKGQNYFKIPGKGFAKIDRQQVLDLEESLVELEGSKNEQGNFQFKNFHALYLQELLPVDWSLHESLKRASESLKNLEKIPSYPLPETIQEVLRPYQQQGYHWLHFLHEYHFHGILADDMGLGKTLQALAFLLDLKNKKGQSPTLILAPTSVVFNWAHEATKFTPDLKFLILTGADRKKNYSQIPGMDLVLTSYAIFRRDAAFLCEQKWRAVILDEAQYIKNFRSKTASLVKKLEAEQRLALTGTPLENRLSELWSIFDFLMPGFLGSIAQFQRRYQKPIEEEQNSQALERLKKKIYPFLLRRQKEEVAPELPPKTEIDQVCEMTPEQRKVYEQILLTSRRLVFNEVEERGIERSHISILTALLRLRQVCCHPQLLGENFKEKDSGKFEMFKELLEEILSEGHRVIVFSQFVQMLTLLRKWLDAQKIAYEYLDGRTRKREEHIRNFQTNNEIGVFLISLKAGGTGLNLSEADYVIHYDPWWNPAVQNQATDRVHRLGQTQHVFAYRLITQDSVEEKILTLQQRKKDLFTGLLTADSKLGKQLSYEDLEYLFS